ncbi:hypothetical protein PP175_05360 [Aneurinibacillus sp. Ricciae_BoGa-3]|uniref:hypothetical protein n=1 Tax=Aneurinibacillus sp. Ricciae_BoGa-3 TaxID=3022697 RepID=UPI00234158C0|nr:hypothetical protein [Aneurinibacillus sp. Ricciae_BoGa-3]WCK55380.1 hypothetical protein PP175_05360 [Aneurinibacillus sp. Ricciae_BoGa-3]
MEIFNEKFIEEKDGVGKWSFHTLEGNNKYEHSFVGIFKNKEFDGKYSRNNIRLMNEYNNEIDEFNLNLEELRKKGQPLKFEGTSEYTNGSSVLVSPLTNITSFLDIECYGRFSKVKVEEISFFQPFYFVKLDISVKEPFKDTVFHNGPNGKKKGGAKWTGAFPVIATHAFHLKFGNGHICNYTDNDVMRIPYISYNMGSHEWKNERGERFLYPMKRPIYGKPGISNIDRGEIEKVTFLKLIRSNNLQRFCREGKL